MDNISGRYYTVRSPGESKTHTKNESKEGKEQVDHLMSLCEWLAGQRQGGVRNDYLFKKAREKWIRRVIKTHIL